MPLLTNIDIRKRARYVIESTALSLSLSTQSNNNVVTLLRYDDTAALMDNNCDLREILKIAYKIRFFQGLW